MRHIFLFAAVGVASFYGIASAAAQSYVSPNSRYLSEPVGYSAADGTAVNGGVINCSYKSAATNTACSSCADDCSCSGGCIGDWRERADSAGWIAGYEFLWLKPHFSNGINFTEMTFTTNSTTVQDHDFSADYDLAPRVWLGYQFCSGLAARIRYWQFDHGLGGQALESTNDIYYESFEAYGHGPYVDYFDAGGGEDLVIQNGIKADVIDVDLTQDFNWRHTRLTLGGGISYAGLRMDRSVAVTGWTGPEGGEYATRFEGVGPTVLAELKRQVRESGFSIVGGVRGTILFGREKSLARETYTWDSWQGPVTDTTIFSRTADRCRAIVAASIGVQYDREIMTGTDAFVRLSWEGQYWNGFGSPVSHEGDLAFEGLGISLGIRR